MTSTGRHDFPRPGVEGKHVQVIKSTALFKCISYF